jgi:hypothetical protein
LSTEEAAAEIVRLINSRSSSPRQDELETIIRRVGGSGWLPPLSSPASVAARARWEEGLAAYHAAAHMNDDEEIDAAHRKAIEATVAIWQAGPRTLADLRLFADVARFWEWDPKDEELDGDYRSLLDIPEGHEDAGGLDRHALALLINAVQTLIGGTPQEGAASVPVGADGYPDFGPVLGNDGKPLSVAHISDRVFVEDLLPVVRIACVMAGKSKQELTEAVRTLLDDDFEIVRAMLDDYRHVANKFRAIAEVVSAVWARAVAVGEVLEDQRIERERIAREARP